MADFSTAFCVKASERMLTHQELVRSIRLMITDEYEAVSIYTQLAESTDNELARRVLMEIADEERVHAGEFLQLLSLLAPDENTFYAQGALEVNELAAGIAGEEKVNETPAAATIGSLKEEKG